MKILINTLLLVFVVQGAVVAGLYWSDEGFMRAPGSNRFIPFEPYFLDEIIIGDDQGNEAVLLKVGNSWVLPDLTGLSVDPELIEALLQNVVHADTSWPVANSVAARQRFALTDYNFLRRLTLIGKGEMLGTIYLGKSPGFKKVYARNSRQNDIFTLSFNSFDASGVEADWLDKRLLQIPSPRSISTDSYSLHKQETDWLSDSGATPDARELDALLLALASIQIQGIAREKLQQTLSIAAPEIKLTVKTVAAETRIALFTLGEKHYIQHSDYALFFTVSDYDFDRFSTLDARRLRGGE